jgi:anti-sigma B factor antagonist
MSPTAPGELDVAIATVGETATVTLGGELDIATAPALERRLREFEGHEHRLLMLDLRKLSFIDSTGLRVVLGIADAASERGDRVAVVRGPEAVQRVFALTGAERELLMVDDPSELDELNPTA